MLLNRYIGCWFSIRNCRDLLANLEKFENVFMYFVYQISHIDAQILRDKHENSKQLKSARMFIVL